MPSLYCDKITYKIINKLRKITEKQVLEKFPNIIKGSSGYNRAFISKFRSIYKNKHLYI